MDQDEVGKLEFSFNGLEVGVFDEDDYPAAPGRYRFIPYRGTGLHQFATFLRTQNPATCVFRDGDSMIAFKVLSIPEYGLFETNGFVCID